MSVHALHRRKDKSSAYSMKQKEPVVYVKQGPMGDDEEGYMTSRWQSLLDRLISNLVLNYPSDRSASIRGVS